MSIKAIGGGVRPKILDFLCLDVCYSPSYLVSKMGSLSSQLCTVAEIRRDKVGHYAHFFRKMYGKFGKKFFFSKNRNNSTPNHFLRLKIGSNLHPMALHNRKDQIFDFRIFSLFTAIFTVQKWPKMAKNGQKRP